MAILLCILSVVNSTVSPSRTDELALTILSVIQVESGGDPCAYNPAEDAAGILQIRPIMVADCNRILRREEFSLADRWAIRRSVEMFAVYSLHYWPKGGPEQWARGWNGGPRGPQKDCTLRYWQRVHGVCR
jgi:hypothetical protein